MIFAILDTFYTDHDHLERHGSKMAWQSGLTRVTRNHVPLGAQVRILVSSDLSRSHFC